MNILADEFLQLKDGLIMCKNSDETIIYWVFYYEYMTQTCY